MSFDQLPPEMTRGERYLEELYYERRAASGDETYANWSTTLTHRDYAACAPRPIPPMRRQQRSLPSSYAAGGWDG